jgi:2-polyprenyl-3-methyl-5-hydroxy-6-metoxy-1,4-benzoquinol methylase
MTKTVPPTNFTKHTSKNPIQKFLIDNFFSSLISLIKPLGAGSILDAGCGEGFTINKLIRNGIGNRIEGIEFSKEAISIGKKLFPNLNIKQGSVYELPFKDKSFDLIICTEVLEHLEEPAKAIKEMLRVTKRYLALSVPNEPFFMLCNFLRGKNLSRLGNDIGHINHWSSSSFKILLENERIRIRKAKLPFPWTIILGEK